MKKIKKKVEISQNKNTFLKIKKKKKRKFIKLKQLNKI